MKIRNNVLALGVAIALASPLSAVADGYYATFQLGTSEQANDAEAYGNNIAVDSDFPRSFDAGDGNVAGVGIGYVISEKFRVEGRIGTREGEFNDRKIGTGARDGEEYILNGQVKSTTLTVEGFYDFPNSSSVTPFIKMGLGVADNSYAARLGGEGVSAFDAFDGAEDGYYDSYADGDSTEFSWNVGFGGQLKLSEKASVYAEYQYATFGDVETGQDSFTDGFKIDGISSQEVVLGVRVNF